MTKDAQIREMIRSKASHLKGFWECNASLVQYVTEPYKRFKNVHTRERMKSHYATRASMIPEGKTDTEKLAVLYVKYSYGVLTADRFLELVRTFSAPSR